MLCFGEFGVVYSPGINIAVIIESNNSVNRISGPELSLGSKKRHSKTIALKIVINLHRSRQTEQTDCNGMNKFQNSEFCSDYALLT